LKTDDLLRGSDDITSDRVERSLTLKKGAEDKTAAACSNKQEKIL
jgi:hypothetical protein